MPNIATTKSLQQAADHLSKTDPILAAVIKSYGLPDIVPHTNYYHELVDSIIGQQLSVKAAHSIRTRFYELFEEDELPSPEVILGKSVEELRSAGLSGAKAQYVQDLTQNVLDGRLDFAAIDTLTSEEVVKKLTVVKGIGEWTAHMFMMFCMGRLDILPVGDLGIKNGIQKLYGLETIPSPDTIREIAVTYHWAPYQSVASWYIWKSLDNSPTG